MAADKTVATAAAERADAAFGVTTPLPVAVTSPVLVAVDGTVAVAVPSAAVAPGVVGVGSPSVEDAPALSVEDASALSVVPTEAGAVAEVVVPAGVVVAGALVAGVVVAGVVVAGVVVGGALVGATGPRPEPGERTGEAALLDADVALGVRVRAGPADPRELVAFAAGPEFPPELLAACGAPAASVEPPSVDAAATPCPTPTARPRPTAATRIPLRAVWAPVYRDFFRCRAARFRWRAACFLELTDLPSVNGVLRVIGQALVTCTT
ncbi:hypothetical protein ACXDF8_03650 [Mycolicibacterium sp. CBM1]